jgi:hypothetical protein
MSTRGLTSMHKPSTAAPPTFSARPTLHRNVGLQRKLTVGAANDPLEHEADRVADQVLDAPRSDSTISPPRIQRHTERSETGAGNAPPSVERVLAEPGRPLQPELQEHMGQRFGYDFSAVRVHTDASAAQSARDLNANAYTAGQHIVFGAGRFSPESHDGRRLIAHELTHVAQQGAADPTSMAQRSSSSDLTIVQRDTSGFPPLSPDVAKSWGISTPPAAAKGSSNSHSSPAGLGPKPQDRTLEGTITAANADPHKAKREKELPPIGDEEVMKMTATQKLSRAVDYAKETFHDDVKAEITALFSPAALVSMALFAALYIAAQATPAGWVADALALAALTISIIFVGTLLFEIMKDLAIFVSAVSARTDSQLRRSGAALSKAIAKAGVALVVALLTRTVKGGGPSKPYASPPPEGFGDAVTTTGMVVRAPVAVLPKPITPSPGLAAVGTAGGRKPTRKDIEGGPRDLDENLDELGDVNAPRSARAPSQRQPVEVDPRAMGWAIEKQHLDSMPDYTQPKAHNFEGIDAWRGGRQWKTKNATGEEVVTIRNADVLQVKGIRSRDPANIRATVRKGVAGIEGVEFKSGNITVREPASRQIDILFDEGILPEISPETRLLLTEQSSAAGTKGIAIRWFRYSSGTKIRIPIP